jgi:hypothetical protein
MMKYFRNKDFMVAIAQIICVIAPVAIALAVMTLPTSQ